MLIKNFIDILVNRLKEISNEVKIDMLDDVKIEYTIECLDELLIKAISFKNRAIPKDIKFNVEISDEGKISLQKLPEDFKNNFKTIYSLLKTGGDVKPYQSKDIVNINDNLLFNWKMNHFHLSSELNTKHEYFKDRSDYVALFIIYEKTIYIVDIVKHPKGSEWMLYDYFSIAVRTWPFIYEEFRIKSSINTSINKTEEEMYQISRLNIIQQFEVDGNRYSPPGGGTAINGTSLLTVKEVNAILIRFLKINDLINNNIKAMQNNFKDIESRNFIIEINSNNCIYLYEKNTNSKTFICQL